MSRMHAMMSSVCVGLLACTGGSDLPPPASATHPFLQGQRVGVAFGSHFNVASAGYVSHLQDLGVRDTNINVWWDEIEPDSPTAPGLHVYRDEGLQSFLAQPGAWEGILRITTRSNRWATTEPMNGSWVPTDLTRDGDYFQYVAHVVETAAGRVRVFESNWEADCTDHFGSHPGAVSDYAQLSRVFYEAVKSVDPDALVIMGGSVGGLGPCTTDFFSALFLELSMDGEPAPFDVFDTHLYGQLYSIPERIRWLRRELDRYSEFADLPIVVTEYGGPSPEEFAAPSVLGELQRELAGDPCLLAGDLTSTPARPAGHPDGVRMFAYGVEPALEARRDRIQGRQIVQRTLLAMAEGVRRLYWWNITTNETGTRPACYFRHPIFGKMSLMRVQAGVWSPNPTFQSYQTMAARLAHVRAVSRVDAGDPDIFLFDVVRGDGTQLYVLWRRRDQFSGEDAPPVPFADLAVPWPSVTATTVFGAMVSATVRAGRLQIDIQDTPVFIEEG